MLTIDHVIMTVADARVFAVELLETTGLAAYEGGRHRGHGTGNWLVPLGDTTLEFLEVVDAAEARTSPLGSWVLAREGRGLALACMQTDDIQAVAARLERPAVPMSRMTTDGDELHWRLVGLDDAVGPEALPFFVQWDVEASAHPGRRPAPHRTRPLGITQLQLGGPIERMAVWLGSHDPSIRLVGGEPGPHTVTIATEDGAVHLTRNGLG